MKMKWCNRCKEHLPVSEFAFSKFGLSTYCHAHSLEASNKSRERKRVKFITEMGGKCVKCGFSDWRALQVDHIQSDGADEREARHNTAKWYKHVLEHPERYQLLCANCNWIKKYELKEYNAKQRQRKIPV
jgi:hypothetical protein